MKKTLPILRAALCLSLALLLLSCNDLDVVAEDSIRAFGDLLQKAPRLTHKDKRGWVITAPDGGASLVIGSDLVPARENVWLDVAAAPFIAAGLDPQKLKAAGQMRYIHEDGLLRIAITVDMPPPRPENAGPLDAYKEIVSRKREAIGWHAALDHYGLSLENGNIFEWAKDMAANDKDLVFVLNPDPFIAAGVNPERVEGWVFAKVTVDDANGKPIQVDKFLKPFDL